MHVHVLQFDERVSLGTYTGWLAESGSDITVWRCDRDEWPDPSGSEPVILLGGYMGVNDRQRLPYLQQTAEWVATVVEGGRPLLAICLGAQLLAHALGGAVTSDFRQEKGIREVALTAAGEADPLFARLPNPFLSFEWHNDSFQLPPQAVLLAATEGCPVQAFRYANAWGVQFHPEVDARIVAEWCQRTDADPAYLADFQQHSADYFTWSKRLLLNFITACRSL